MKFKRIVGHDVELVIENLSELDPSYKKQVRLHLADSNYGVKYYPNKNELIRLRNAIDKAIEKFFPEG